MSPRSVNDYVRSKVYDRAHVTFWGIMAGAHPDAWPGRAPNVITHVQTEVSGQTGHVYTRVRAQLDIR